MPLDDVNQASVSRANVDDRFLVNVTDPLSLQKGVIKVGESPSIGWERRMGRDETRGGNRGRMRKREGEGEGEGVRERERVRGEQEVGTTYLD